LSNGYGSIHDLHVFYIRLSTSHSLALMHPPGGGILWYPRHEFDRWGINGLMFIHNLLAARLMRMLLLVNKIQVSRSHYGLDRAEMMNLEAVGRGDCGAVISLTGFNCT
jgi:hypothetical protein